MSSTSTRKLPPPRASELARQRDAKLARHLARVKKKKAQAAPERSEQSGEAPLPRVQLSLLGESPEVTGPASDECYTPSSILDPVIELLEGIDTDPCWSPSSLVRPRHGYTIAQNGLKQPWYGTVWLNPPYSAPAEFIQRAAEHAAEGHRVAALLNLDPSTKAWRHTLGASALGLWPSRIKFAGEFAGGGAARFSCALVLWNIEIEAAISKLPKVAWYTPHRPPA